MYLPIYYLGTPLSTSDRRWDSFPLIIKVHNLHDRLEADERHVQPQGEKCKKLSNRKYNIQIGGVILKMCTISRVDPFSIDVKGGEKYIYKKEE
jgi:hypothetical protein